MRCLWIGESTRTVGWPVPSLVRSVTDIDYSAGLTLEGLLDFTDAPGITVALARADVSLIETLDTYGLTERITREHIYDKLSDAYVAFLADQPADVSDQRSMMNDQ